MGFDNLLVEKSGSIARITINRPSKLNALSIRTVVELIEAFSQMRDDSDVGVVILTGAGDRSFAAGADIPELLTLDPIEGKAFAARGQHLTNLIENLGKPVVAAVNGFALGGGCELALACTVRVAVDRARIGLPEINLGTMPGYGGTQRMARLVPRGIAMELVTTGRVLTAAEALAIGLVNRVAPPSEFPGAVDDMARLFLKKPAFSLGACIEAVLHGPEMAFEDALKLEASLFAMTCGTADMKEGLQAFLDKREAAFKGH
jgi:enoyl-CoA hydratase